VYDNGMKYTSLFFVTLLAFSQTPPKTVASEKGASVPSGPVEGLSGTLRAEIAIAQRNFLAAQTQVANASKEMQDVSTKADTECKKIDKLFDPASITCVPKPASPAK
jgi:hypothetical protein